MFSRMFRYSPLFVITFFLLAGCSDTATSTRTVDTSTYLFYSPYNSTTGQFGLTAVDPDFPASPVTIVSLAGGTPSANKAVPQHYMTGTVSGSNISDLHYHYVVYGTGTSAGNGNLYRLNARKDNGLATTQISSESQAFDICPDGGMAGPVTHYNIFGPPSVLANSGTTAAYTDYTDPLKSVYIYTKDAGAGGCFQTSTTATVNVVRLDQATGVAPYTTTAANGQYPVAPAYNSDGSLNSLFLWSASNALLTRRNIDATLPTPVSGFTSLANVIAKPRMLNIGTGGQVLFSIANTGSLYKLYIYNPSTQSLNLVHDTSSGEVISAASDGSNFYYHVGNTIYRVPHKATGFAQVATVTNDTLLASSAIYAGDIFVPNRDIVISNGKLIYSLLDLGGTNDVYIRSVSASATNGTAGTIYKYTASDLAPPLRIFAASGRIYLTLLDPMNAVSIPDTGGSPLVFSNSRWLGFTYHPSTRLFGEYDQSGGNMRTRSMFRAAYNPLDLGVVTGLYSYDADTTALLVDFGATAPGLSTYLAGFVPDMLGLATRERTLFAYNNAAGGQDILYLHARDASSARQVTYNDPNTKQLIGMHNGSSGCALGNGDFDPLLPLLTLLAAGYLLRRRLPRMGDQGSKAAVLIAVLGLAALPAHEAKAEDVAIVPGVGLGQSGMDFTRSTGENDQATFNVIEASMTAAFKGAYLRGSAELPLGESYSHGLALVRQFKREDASVTLGWHPFQTFSFSSTSLNNWLGGFSIFTGYSSGKTSVVTHDGGAGLPPYAVYTEYLDKGMYYGMGYSLRIGDMGSLSLNFAQAAMDGSLIVEPSALGAVKTTETGTTEGLSYGLSWAGSLRDKATYYLAFRQRSYTTDLVTISVDKQFRIISAGFIFPM